jgi:hypothetical protein
VKKRISGDDPLASCKRYAESVKGAAANIKILINVNRTGT